MSNLNQTIYKDDIYGLLFKKRHLGQHDRED